jgi:hypothetical protein
MCRYKLGFCPNGPDCHYRHQKLPGPPPLVEQNLQKRQHRIYAVNNNAHNGKFQPPCSQDGPLAARVGGWVPGEEARLPHSVLPAAAQQLPAQTTPPHAVSSGPPNPPPFVSTAAPLPGDFCRLVMHFRTFLANGRCSYFSSVCYALMCSYF